MFHPRIGTWLNIDFIYCNFPENSFISFNIHHMNIAKYFFEFQLLFVTFYVTTGNLNKPHIKLNTTLYGRFQEDIVNRGYLGYKLKSITLEYSKVC